MGEKNIIERENVKNRIKAIISGIMTDVDQNDITEEKHLVHDFRLDSLGLLELFLDIMLEYNIQLEREEIVQMMRLGALYDRIYEKTLN